ncbi:MAG: hypothetical protein QNK37_29325 [Acidobacteriota bacterium]|nr:hypothetical protein [Acidobacteriota bacterium]
MSLRCRYAGVCSGCPWIHRSRDRQHADKAGRLRNLWTRADLPLEDLNTLQLTSIGEGGLRDRADMTLHRENGRTHLGLYDVDRRVIVDLEECPQMSPALAEWFHDFRAMIPPIQFGHLRLRVAPDGTRGIWLDFPNRLLDQMVQEDAWLRELARVAVVELSQRRNRLRVSPQGLTPAESELYPWFETYTADGRTLPLYCTIGAFTQPGFRADKALVGLMLDMASARDTDHWLELGAGIGNFTLPLTASGAKVTALENDPRALAGLEYGAKEAGLDRGIFARTANIHSQGARLKQHLAGIDAILADPPRSGLRGFVDNLAALEPQDRPRRFLYISCFDRSLVTDIAALYNLGYRLKRMEGLDQFPQSSHCEWAALLTRT